MASVCMSSCVDDARVPVRATYTNLYKWPESDAAFVRYVSSKGREKPGGGSGGGSVRGHPEVVDSMSCRQLFLRSYTFSRKERMPEKTKKCIGRVREKVAVHRRMRKPLSGGKGGGAGVVGGRRKNVVIRKVKKASCAALASIFRRLLSCTTKVDVVDGL